MAKPVSFRTEHISGRHGCCPSCSYQQKNLLKQSMNLFFSCICPHIPSMTSIYFSISIATVAMKLPQTQRISKLYQIMLRDKVMIIMLLMDQDPLLVNNFIMYKISQLVLPFLWRQGRNYYLPFINEDTGTQKLNDLSKVTPGDQGLEATYSIYITLLLKEA